MQLSILSTVYTEKQMVVYYFSNELKVDSKVVQQIQFE